MAPEQESKIPSVAELQKYVREKTKLEFILLDGKCHIGTLKWFDHEAFALVEEGENGATQLTLLRHNVLGYKPVK
jgi:hypothetical protein